MAFAVAALLGAAAPSPAGATAAQPTTWGGLRDGALGSYSWAASAATGTRGTTCLKVAITDRRGPFTYDRSRFRRCAPVLRAKAAPLISGGTALSGGRGAMTVLALAFAPGVDRAQLQFAGQDPATIIPQRLPQPAQSSAQPVRDYALLAFRGHHCLRRVVSEDAQGRSLWTEEGDRCLPGYDAGA